MEEDVVVAIEIIEMDMVVVIIHVIIIMDINLIIIVVDIMDEAVVEDVVAVVVEEEVEVEVVDLMNINQKIHLKNHLKKQNQDFQKKNEILDVA